MGGDVARIFISYKRDSEDDETLSRLLRERLASAHQVFIDKQIAPGAEWAKRISEELKASDFVLVLLSRQSVSSEMVISEVETVRRAFDGQKPRLVPIRVNYDEEYPYPLGAYLGRFQWVAWHGAHDTDLLLRMLAATFSGRDLDSPSQSSSRISAVRAIDAMPVRESGPVVQSGYLVRDVERYAIGLLRDVGKKGITLNVVGPRQMGKSMLVRHACKAARQAGKRVALIDLKLFDGATLKERFYECFCQMIADELEIELALPSSWAAYPRPHSCTKYLEKLLRKTDSRVVLVLDELERLLQLNGYDDFFSMLRHWHENQDEDTFARLDLVLVATLDLHRFTTRVTSSPFNVGQRLELNDFSLEETRLLAQAHNIPPEVAERMHQLLGGHPWLTKLAFDACTSNKLRMTADTNAEDLLAESSPFLDHLRQCLFRLQALESEAQEDVGRAFHGKPCSEAAFVHLQGAGFLRGVAASPKPRCELYGAYLRRYFKV
jgi:hypothetical protein